MQGWSGLRTQAWTCGRGGDQRPECGWSGSTIHPTTFWNSPGEDGLCRRIHWVGQDLITAGSEARASSNRPAQLAAGSRPGAEAVQLQTPPTQGLDDPSLLRLCRPIHPQEDS
jgi:hypothetical protein